MPEARAGADLYEPTFDVTWARHRLHDLATWTNGMAFKNVDFSPTGVPVVKIAEVKNGITGQTKFTTGSYDPKFFLRDGDMLFCWSGQPETSIDAYRWRGGDGWLNQHTFKVAPKEDLVEDDFFYYLLCYLRPTFVRIARNKQTTGLGHVTKADLQRLVVGLPPRTMQRTIAVALRSLDNMAESARRQRELLRQLGKAKLKAAVAVGGRDALLADLSASIARGVAPKYADDDAEAQLVINQKCIRNGWVNPALARRMAPRAVKPEKRAQPGDVFVNSTGTGTLGRVGRWHDGEVFVDSHVTIVRPDPIAVQPTVLAYSLLDREADIEAMATGSTGQTELSGGRLGELVVSVPGGSAAELLEADLVSLEARIAVLLVEEGILVQLRDVLLPELVSGHITVRGAVQAVEAIA